MYFSLYVLQVAFDKELQSLSSGNPFNKALFDVLFVVAAWLKDPLLAVRKETCMKWLHGWEFSIVHKNVNN